MSVNERYVQAQHQLIGSGFHPERYGFIVKFVRRFLWPFIRPFHFYELRQILELEARLESELSRQNALAEERFAQIKAVATGEAERLSNELESLSKEHVLVRSDVEALKNRYALLESLYDRVKQLEGLYDSVSQLQGGFEANRQHLEAISEELRDKPGSGELQALKDSLGKIPPRELAITSTRYGLYIGKPGEIISDHIFRGGLWDKHVLDLAQEVSRSRGGRALDIGSHLGAVAVGLASMFDEVIGFEPNDFNFKILSANVVINGLKNVRLFNRGVYSRETNLALGEQEKQEIAISKDEFGKFDGHAAGNLGAYLFTEQTDGVFGHVARTIDSYQFDEVSFIKIDVQGADGEVLMGALETIRRCQPVVVFEWEDLLSRNFNVTFDHVVGCLADIGYVVTPLKVHNEKQIDYVARPVKSAE
jgi:FkbM family methyltransferase